MFNFPETSSKSASEYTLRGSQELLYASVFVFVVRRHRLTSRLRDPHGWSISFLNATAL